MKFRLSFWILSTSHQMEMSDEESIEVSEEYDQP